VRVPTFFGIQVLDAVETHEAGIDGMELLHVVMCVEEEHACGELLGQLRFQLSVKALKTNLIVDAHLVHRIL